MENIEKDLKKKNFCKFKNDSHFLFGLRRASVSLISSLHNREKYKSASYLGPNTGIKINSVAVRHDGRTVRGDRPFFLSLECSGEVLPVLCPGFSFAYFRGYS